MFFFAESEALAKAESAQAGPVAEIERSKNKSIHKLNSYLSENMKHIEEITIYVY